jgi:hypothetical protein
VLIDPVYDEVIPNAFTPDPTGGGQRIYTPLDLATTIFYPFNRFVKELKIAYYRPVGRTGLRDHGHPRGWMAITAAK